MLKTKIKLNKKEKEMFDELLVFAMEEMMSLNNQNKYSNPPIFTDEQNSHLKEMMDFTCKLLKQIRHSYKGK